MVSKVSRGWAARVLGTTLNGKIRFFCRGVQHLPAKTQKKPLLEAGPAKAWLVMKWVLLDVWLDGVTPNKVARAHEVEAVVGEVSAQAAVLVGKQGI